MSSGGAGTRARPSHLRTPPVDPRIRARRVAVRRDAGRRRLRRLRFLGVVLVVLVGFVGALRSPLLDVDAVRVAGTRRTAPQAVVTAAGIEPGEQLVDLDLGAAGARVAALPWVGEVHIHRALGGAVDIRVVERDPAAVVGEGPTAVLVDVQGRILARVTDLPEVAAPLVRVQGLTTDLPPGASLSPDTLDALALAARLAAAVPGAIAEVALGDDLVATLAQGGAVRFGNTDRLTAKLRSLETVLARVDLSCLELLDLRAPTSPVLTRREPCS